MDDLQVVIYIVFLAIYFLSRFLKGSKQKQTPRREAREVNREEDTAQDEERPMTFEDILRELTQPKERPKPKPQSRPKPIPARKEYEFRGSEPDDDEIQEVFEESKRRARGIQTIDEMVDIGEGSIKFREYEEKLEEDNEYASEIRDMLKNPDDVRKAVILKEILDRKF